MKFYFTSCGKARSIPSDQHNVCLAWSSHSIGNRPPLRSLHVISGDVSIGELMNASPWHKTGLRTIQGFPEYTLPQIRALYRDMDANGDGKVTLAEMTSMIVKYMDVAEEVGVGTPVGK